MNIRDASALAGPLAAVSFVGGAAGAAALADAPFPRPGSSAEQIGRYFGDNAGPARLSVAGQLISAGALGLFAEAVAGLATGAQPGRRLATIARVGGFLSVLTLTASALTSLHLTRPGVAKSKKAPALHRRAFLAGGPLHGPGIGLLMGALGVAGLRTHRLPRWLSYAAVGNAAAGVLTPVSLIVKPAVWLIPASRFPGLLLAAGAGVALSRR